MVIRYGIIGDIHENTAAFDALVDKLLQKGIDKFVLEGGLGYDKKTINHVLETIGKTKKPAYVIPGHSEPIIDYLNALYENQEKYSNLIDVLDENNRFVNEEDHNLAFIPGANPDISPSVIQTDTAESGFYIFFPDSEGKNGEYLKVSYSDIEEIKGFEDIEDRLVYVTNPNSLEEKLKGKDISKTIVLNHTPSRFNKEGCVDYAHILKGYYLTSDNDGNKGYALIPHHIPGSRKDAIKAKDLRIIEESEYEGDEEKLKKIVDPLMERKIPEFYIETHTSLGDKTLQDTYNKLNITKVISNHIPEASHNAHDQDGNPITKNTFTDTLFYNSGCADENKAGILTVDGKNVQYTNIDLN